LFLFATLRNNQGDDFDLNEIFAEYFISEFENPVNAYTQGMGNYAPGNNTSQAGVATAPHLGNAAPPPPTNSFAPAPINNTVQQQQQQQVQQQVQPLQQQPGLSSGIRTAYHTAVAAPPVQPQQQQYGLPIAKRPKLEPGVKTAQVPANVAMTGGVTSRLGFNTGILQQGGIMSGGIHAPLAQQQQIGGQYQQQQGGIGGGVALPVGRGIRLGGAGGVAPATARKVPGVAGGMIWGGPQMMGMSDQAVAERRQRNREHAKRSRVRKKFMLESLQEQVAALQRENQRLRIIVQDSIPEHAQVIISECCTSSPLFGDGGLNPALPSIGLDDESVDGKKASALVRSDFQLIDSLSAGQQNFVLSDPRLPDNPIVFATPGFYKLTGYTAEQVLGRNCRFLQGSGTDPKTVDIVRKAIQSGSDCTVCILNYKADGTPFWNQFFVAALRDSDNCIVNYVSH
jgi:PAS domain S-box-containing protein